MYVVLSKLSSSSSKGQLEREFGATALDTWTSRSRHPLSFFSPMLIISYRPPFQIPRAARLTPDKSARRLPRPARSSPQVQGRAAATVRLRLFLGESQVISRVSSMLLSLRIAVVDATRPYKRTDGTHSGQSRRSRIPSASSAREISRIFVLARVLRPSRVVLVHRAGGRTLAACDGLRWPELQLEFGDPSHLYQEEVISLLKPLALPCLCLYGDGAMDPHRVRPFGSPALDGSTSQR